MALVTLPNFNTYAANQLAANQLADDYANITQFRGLFDMSAMPNYDETVDLSNSAVGDTFTAPDDGYLYTCMGIAGVITTPKKKEIPFEFPMFVDEHTGSFSVWIPLRKDDTFTFKTITTSAIDGTKFIQFYPLMV